YLEALSSDVADRVNATDIGAGAVLAALYLREFTGSMRDSWAHIDMSSPAWSETNDGETVKGATGWGVRTLLRWLESLAACRLGPLPAGPLAALAGRRIVLGPRHRRARQIGPPADPRPVALANLGRLGSRLAI